jgi:drug/metabolite transporter (DMT)-like permease
MMNKFLEIGLILVGALAIAVADVLDKKVGADAHSFAAALKNPWLIPIALLYISQIFIYTYLFYRKAELGIVGVIQIVLYTIVVVGSGVLFFKEKITLLQGIGIVLALGGVTLMNL